MAEIKIKKSDTHATPPTGYSSIYTKTDDKWYAKTDAGVESELGSSSPAAHKTTHENGGADEISVAGLSGVLADRQDANKIIGTNVAISGLTRANYLVYDEINDQWVNEKLPAVPYGVVLAKDTTLTWADIESYYKFVPVNTEPSLLSHVGNGTVAYLDGITKVSGDSYTVTDTGTLTAGSLSVVPGDIVIYYGAPYNQWIRATTSMNGVDAVIAGLMVQLSTTTPLISPYTDGTDDGKLIAFDGTDLIGVETSQDITITLPNCDDIPYNDGRIRGMYYIGKMAESGTVTIKPQVGGVADSFMDGASYVILTEKMQQCTLAVVNASLLTKWMRISSINNKIQVRRAATWDATNFATDTAIPFDTEDAAGSHSVSDWDSGLPTKLTAKLHKTFTFSGHINIDTTGGSTWIFEAYLRKNGSYEIPGSRIRTGNYQGEDMAVTLSPIEVELNENDYIEWMCDHTTLTGNMYSATLTMSTTY